MVISNILVIISVVLICQIKSKANDSDITNIWPIPQHFSIGNQTTNYTLNDLCYPNITFICNSLSTQTLASNLLQTVLASIIYPQKCPSVSTKTSSLLINIEIYNSTYSYPSLNSNESYNLSIANSNIQIFANEYPGYARALATLVQLFTFSKKTFFLLNNVEIYDFPRFPHRGLLIDTSRHYLEESTINQILLNMFYSKINVLHWSMVNTDSFPFFAAHYPQVTLDGCFTKNKIYYQATITSIVETAKIYGIRVIVEINTPAHTLSWLWSIQLQFINVDTFPLTSGSFIDTLAVEGQFDPTQNATYNLINDIYNDATPLFPDEYFHLGGNDIDLNSFDTNSNTNSFMIKNNMTDEDLVNMYFSKREKVFEKENKNKLFWYSASSSYINYDNNSILQLLDTSSTITTFLNNLTSASNSYKALFSPTDFYDLTTGLQNDFGMQTGVYNTWWDIYNFEPSNFYDGTEVNLTTENEWILGGEVLLWGNYANDMNILTRLFHRAFSSAEILWSNQNITIQMNMYQVATRLITFNNLLITRGLPSEPVSSCFCESKPRLCWDPQS